WKYLCSLDRLMHISSAVCFQAEDGIRDFHVTGVQTCALPIYSGGSTGGSVVDGVQWVAPFLSSVAPFSVAGCTLSLDVVSSFARSEERRVGKECRCRRSWDH